MLTQCKSNLMQTFLGRSSQFLGPVVKSLENENIFASLLPCTIKVKVDGIKKQRAIENADFCRYSSITFHARGKGGKRRQKQMHKITANGCRGWQWGYWWRSVLFFLSLLWKDSEIFCPSTCTGSKKKKEQEQQKNPTPLLKIIRFD